MHLLINSRYLSDQREREYNSRIIRVNNKENNQKWLKKKGFVTTEEKYVNSAWIRSSMSTIKMFGGLEALPRTVGKLSRDGYPVIVPDIKGNSPWP